MRKASHGAVFRMCRELAGLSQEELARKMNRDRSTISRIESGELIPDLITIREWAIHTGGAEFLKVYLFSYPPAQELQLA